MSSRMSSRMPGRMPSRMPSRILSHMPSRMPDRMRSRMLSHMPDCMPNRMPNCMSRWNRWVHEDFLSLTHDFLVRAHERLAPRGLDVEPPEREELLSQVYL